MSFLTTTPFYVQLVQSAKNYIGPVKNQLTYSETMSMLSRDDVKASTTTVLKALNQVETTRRHLEPMNTERFLKAFTAKYYPTFMFFDKERPIALPFLRVADALVDEFDILISVLRENKLYSFQTFYALMAEYNEAFDAWSKLVEFGLPRKLQSVMITVDRSLRLAHAEDLAIGVILSFQARFDALKSVLVSLPDGEALVAGVENYVRIEREIYGTELGFDRRIVCGV